MDINEKQWLSKLILQVVLRPSPLGEWKLFSQQMQDHALTYLTIFSVRP